MFSAGDLQCPSDMRLVPAGRVTLGSDEGVGEADEHPSRSIYLNAYCLDTYVFANQDTTRVKTILAGQGKQGFQLPRSPEGFDEPKQPLIANWNQANAICNAQGKRLPTEAEFERAMRGKNGTCTYGTKSCTELKSNEALFHSNGPTANVDAYPPSDLGLYGLAGNVWQWASDWYQKDYYQFRGDNPQGPTDSDSRRSPWKVLKGGSWGVSREYLRATGRYALEPDYSGVWPDAFGFRCASTPASVKTPVRNPISGGGA